MRVCTCPYFILLCNAQPISLGSLLFSWGNKRDVSWGEWSLGELEGIEGGDAVVEMYYMREVYFFLN